MKNILTLSLLCLLLTTAYSLTTFTHTYDTRTRNTPYYDLGYIYQGTSIQVNISIPGTTGNNLIQAVGFFSVNVFPENNPGSPLTQTSIPATVTATTLSVTLTFQVTTSDSYILQITQNNYPARDDGTVPQNFKYFYLHVTSFLTDFGGPTNASATVTTIYKATEVFRDRVTRLIYIDSSAKLSFSIWPVPQDGGNLGNPDLDEANLYLYQVNQIRDSQSTYILTGNDLLANTNFFTQTTWTTTNRRLRYDQSSTTSYLAPGYYVLVAFYDSTVPAVTINFDSDRYACPFDSNFPDKFQNMQPCQHVRQSQAGFPCINFDTVNLRCLQCYVTHTLVNGTCLQNDTCPDRQYYEFGRCLPVSDACDLYDAFTGYCITCKLNDSTITNGVCEANPVICDDRQYLDDRQCKNVSDLCDDFDNTTGACTSCIEDHELQDDGTCEPIIINCAENQYQQNKDCKAIPKECALFNKAAGRCVRCIVGWWTSDLGVCQQVKCPEREVPSQYGFFCIKVSDKCDEYDNKTGYCLSCRDKDATVQDGHCRQFTSPLAGCQERQRLGHGQCTGVLQNCDLYNLITKNCEKCLKGWHFDYRGLCSLKDAVCQADQISIKGHCHQLPQYCRELNDAGVCSKCKEGYEIQYGICYKRKTCAENQYLHQNRVCVDVTPGCKKFNPSSGLCYECNDGSVPVNKKCCPAGTYGFGNKCITSIAYRDLILNSETSDRPTCTGYHPTMGHCLSCNGNFQVSKIDPFTCA